MTEYRDTIKTLLPRRYAELFGRDDDETDYKPRQAGRPPDRPCPADPVGEENDLQGNE